MTPTTRLSHGLTRADVLIQIGVLAERVGLSVRTVRYYEEVGLVVPATRTKGGFRLYGPDQEQRLMLIQQMKPLGFSLDEMRELLDTLAAADSAIPGTPVAARITASMTDLLDRVHERRATLNNQLKAADRLVQFISQAAKRIELPASPPGY